MIRMSHITTLAMQKLIDLVDEFNRGDCDKNEAKRTSASTKGPIGADYLSFNHVSHTVSNFVSNFTKNVSNYLTPDTKKTFDKLRQPFTEAPIFQYFDPKQYIRVKINMSKHTIGRMLSQLTNNLDQWHPVAYFLCKMIPTKT